MNTHNNHTTLGEGEWEDQYSKRSRTTRHQHLKTMRHQHQHLGILAIRFPWFLHSLSLHHHLPITRLRHELCNKLLLAQRPITLVLMMI